MEIKIICLLFTAYVNIVAIAENSPRREKFRISIDNLEPESFESENHKRYNRVITIRKDNDQFREMENLRNGAELMDKSHEKILKFEERLYESVKEYGILKDKAILLGSGQYHIDWWKNDRRLEKIRRRLYKTLAEMPGLNDHLHRLGWRSTSENSPPERKNHPHRLEIKRSLLETENSFVNKIMMMRFAELLDLEPGQLNQEIANSGSIVFVYTKMMLSRPSKIHAIDGAAGTSTVPESSMKFSLDTPEPQDSELSDVGVIDIESQSLPILNPVDDSTSEINSGGESIDTDRILQLIPLIIDELRKERFDDDERRSLSWIFGKRLWQLLERDAWKNPNDLIDKDLAVFLIKGELPERNSMRPKRRSRQSGHSQFNSFRKRRIPEYVAKEDEETNERYTDYDFQSSDEIYYNRKSKDSSLYYFDRDNDHEKHEKLRNMKPMSRTTTYEFRKLLKVKQAEEVENMKKGNTEESLNTYKVLSNIMISKNIF